MWTLKNGNIKTECTSFPYAFRTAFNAVRKATENKKDPVEVASNIVILGPANTRGERAKYTYSQAMELARSQGLLNNDNQINGREFKRR